MDPKTVLLILIIWALFHLARAIFRKVRGYPSKDQRLILLTLYGAAGWYGAFEVMRVTGVSAGVVYPFLTKAVQKEWLAHMKETPLPRDRPPKTLYHLTEAGRSAIFDLLKLEKLTRLGA